MLFVLGDAREQLFAHLRNELTASATNNGSGPVTRVPVYVPFGEGLGECAFLRIPMRRLDSPHTAIGLDEIDRIPVRKCWNDDLVQVAQHPFAVHVREKDL